MRTFRHRHLGYIATQENSALYKFLIEDMGYLIPTTVVESGQDWEEVKEPEMDAAEKFYLDRFPGAAMTGEFTNISGAPRDIQSLRDFAAQQTSQLRSENEELRSSLQNLESYVNQSANKKWTDDDMCDVTHFFEKNPNCCIMDGIRFLSHRRDGRIFVKITKCKCTYWWYASSVGQTVEVEEENASMWKMKRPGPFRTIDKDDCVVVTNFTAQ